MCACWFVYGYVTFVQGAATQLGTDVVLLIVVADFKNDRFEYRFAIFPLISGVIFASHERRR